MSVALTLLASLAISATAAPILPNSAAPQPYVENAITAQFFNQQFAAMAETDPCTGNQTACVNGAFAMCVEDEWVITPCASGLVCAAVPQSSTVGYVLSCDTTADIEQHFAFAGIDSGLGNATVVASGCDDSDSTTEGNATTSALPVAPTASANATLAPVRRFHPRQLSVNGLTFVPGTPAQASTSAALASVTGTATFVPSAIISSPASTALASTTVPVASPSGIAVPADANAASTVIGADGLPTALVVVTVPATGPAPVCASSTALPSPASATALPADPTSIALGLNVNPTTTSTLTVTAGTGAVAASSADVSALSSASVSAPTTPVAITSAIASAVPVPSLLPNPLNSSAPPAVASASVAVAAVSSVSPSASSVVVSSAASSSTSSVVAVSSATATSPFNFQS